MKKTLFGNYYAVDVNNILLTKDNEYEEAQSLLTSKDEIILDLESKIDSQKKLVDEKEKIISDLQSKITDLEKINETTIEEVKVKANMIEIESLSKLNAQLEQKISNFENEFELKKENAKKELKKLDDLIEVEKEKFNTINQRLKDILNEISNNIYLNEDYINQNNKEVSSIEDDEIVSEEVTLASTQDALNKRFEEESKKLNELVKESLENIK
jgi:hypothetical protein